MQHHAGSRGAPPKAAAGGKKRGGGKPGNGVAAAAHAAGGSVVRVFVETSLDTKLLVAVAPETTVEGLKGAEQVEELAGMLVAQCRGSALQETAGVCGP